MRNNESFIACIYFSKSALNGGNMSIQKYLVGIGLLIVVCLGLWGSQAKRRELPVSFQEEENGQKIAALTFDDGPHPVYTEALLDGLKKRNVKATFFLIGKSAEKYPELVNEWRKKGI